jgi:hypothetical protein
MDKFEKKMTRKDWKLFLESQAELKTYCQKYERDFIRGEMLHQIEQRRAERFTTKIIRELTDFG